MYDNQKFKMESKGSSSVSSPVNPDHTRINSENINCTHASYADAVKSSKDVITSQYQVEEETVALAIAIEQSKVKFCLFP